MHIILGLLGVIVTILILVNRLKDAGIDIRDFNPFAWHRRRQFKKDHDLNPAFKLNSPLDAAALLMTAILKIDGDITQNEKELLLSLFQKTFHLSESDSKSLLRSSVHLIGVQEDVLANPDKVLSRSVEQFTHEQAMSLVELLKQLAALEGSTNQEQMAFIDTVKGTFSRQNPTSNSGWS